ncbi:MAG: hypothetical protein JO078_05550 [Candidatus Eremiobacteraeota bacterium]|nr:hypothetical protein [Candidatus Eremiobacteraeota bacterium]MBV9056700.1 hypothetical protein [Candidatus Eremiobacteraeota bacterium]MBV9699573.1 hypothetical protein [Candidatus Eremiobacteraeota bacterium]
MRPLTRAAALLPAILLVGATNAPGGVGFAKLSVLISSHPLAPMLGQYDREIAGLRSTASLEGLRDPARQAERSAMIVAHRSATANGQIERIASAPQSDRQSERAALADIASAQRSRDSALTAYRAELARETNATLRDYAAAIAQRNTRALSAREQQLREKELTLAFDLARRNGGARLALRLRLQDLHLTSAKRRLLATRLAALDAAEHQTVAAQTRRDAGSLAAYRQTVTREGDASLAALAAQLHSKGAANLDLRMGVARSESELATAVPNLSERMRVFAADYSGNRTAGSVAAALSASARGLPQRFRAVADADRTSAAQTATQIETLARNRLQLYRSIVAHIERLAQRVAQQRGLRQVVVGRAAPRGSVDVTAAVAGLLRSF